MGYGLFLLLVLYPPKSPCPAAIPGYLHQLALNTRLPHEPPAEEEWRWAPSPWPLLGGAARHCSLPRNLGGPICPDSLLGWQHLLLQGLPWPGDEATEATAVGGIAAAFDRHATWPGDIGCFSTLEGRHEQTWKSKDNPLRPCHFLLSAPATSKTSWNSYLLSFHHIEFHCLPIPHASKELPGVVSLDCSLKVRTRGQKSALQKEGWTNLNLPPVLPWSQLDPALYWGGLGAQTSGFCSHSEVGVGATG